MAYLLFNNSIVRENEVSLTPVLLEAPLILKHYVWYGFGGIPLLKENIVLLEQKLHALNRELPALFKNQREFSRLLKRTLNKNRYYRSGLFIIQLFLGENRDNFMVSCRPFTESGLPRNPQGLFLHVAKPKIFSQLNNYTGSLGKEELWRQASATQTDMQNSKVVLLNQREAVSEGIGSNIFMVKENHVFTPALTTGCFADVLRPEVLRLCEKLKMKIIESDNLTPKHMQQMDEVFFVSEMRGVQWILGFQERRYVHEFSDKIYKELNHFIQEKVQG
ncbi:aminotransferase class IV [uncultured Draconibacterium sp.]|uniref:aminotransferase class IV n=1 Tax=uncultured Draconibacterium sp. TaxID=1573823 RepID=UPI0025EE240A|nr:aminotransferase class IV [uncultured Draconibacterium sp.]